MLNNRPGGYVPARVNVPAQMNKYWKVKKGHHNYNWKESGKLGYNVRYRHNRLKPARKYISKKKFGYNIRNSAPLAPRNTTSFIIRAKRSGGITSLVSPGHVTPAEVVTTIFSPSREEDLVDMAKREWGLDGYGSMKGLIRLRSPGNEEECGLNGSVIDHDLSRFEMINPNYGVAADQGSRDLVNRVDDQDTHIAKLEEENLVLKERFLFMEREVSKLKTRVQCLERKRRGAEGFAENDSGSRGYENKDVAKLHMENNGKSECGH